MALYDDPAWTGKINVTKKGDRLDFNDQVWVAWEDYQLLQTALREALQLAQQYVEGIVIPTTFNAKRIAALRAQFLDDTPKEPS